MKVSMDQRKGRSVTNCGRKVQYEKGHSVKNQSALRGWSYCISSEHLNQVKDTIWRIIL